MFLALKARNSKGRRDAADKIVREPPSNVVLKLPFRYFNQILLHGPSPEFLLRDSIVNILHRMIVTKIKRVAASVKLIQQSESFMA